jgi:hypothetical protein
MSASDLARRSCAWDRVTKGDAELTIAIPTDEAILLGAFQRPSEVLEEPALPRLRRGSGGGAARVGPGTIWMQLALAHPGALVPCTPDKLLNRYVRPLLRALTRATRVPARYFGRDWISASHRPIALVSFAHEAVTGKSLFEAIIAVNHSVTLSSRSSFRGRPSATCDEISGRPIDPSAVVETIVDAYAAEATDLQDVGSADVAFATEDDAVVVPAPPWAVIREEAIGTLAAGRDPAGRLEIGGELMASRDAMTRLRDDLAKLPSGATPDDVGRVVDDALTGHGAITFGVRSLASIRDAIVEATLRTSLEARSRT